MERLAAHDRIVVMGAAGLIALCAALYTVFGIGMQMTAAEMTAMARPLGQPMQMGAPPVWTSQYAALIFLMWWVMMIAMMTPSAAPVLLLFTAVKKSGPDAARAARLSLVFLSGYLLAWGGFSAIAAALQWGVEATGLSEGPMMTLRSRLLAGGLLAAAGLYQLTPLKQACLEHCKSPAQFLALHARPGARGALLTGMHHGAYCLGCCWALMALLFAGGIMNLYWIAGLALYVLAEKLLPGGLWFSRITGWLLLAAGLWVMTAS